MSHHLPLVDIMKKNILFILMACLLCQSFIIGFNQQNFADYNNSLPKAGDDDYESNDSYDQATPFEYSYNYGMFILQDIDWFVLSLNASDNITIIIQTDSVLADMDINFYESDGITPVAGAVLGGNGTMWMIAVPNLPYTGLYYFSLLPLGDPFAYYFIEIENEFDDNYEYNDVIADAVDVGEDFGYDILYCFNDDWYKIYLEEGWSIYIDFAYYKTGSFELNFIGTDGTTILNASEEYFEEDEDYGIVWKAFLFNESVINTTGYYYIQVSSDTPTIYMLDFYAYVVEPFEDSLTLYQYSNNEISLEWNYLENTEFYYVFRETSPITTVDGLTPYATTEDTWFSEYIEKEGIYYYVVMANNGTHNSSITNCVNATIVPFDEMTISLGLYQYGENEISMYWSYLEDAEIYYIFQENSEITTVDGLTPCATTEDTSYWENIEENGTYYYVVMGNNGTYNSSISNCVNVTVRPFEEIPITLYLYQYGQGIWLNWNSIYSAEFYYVFRETSPITTVDGLTPYAISEYSWYDNFITENGTFYYVVMANNSTHNSSISNCVNITITLYPFNEIVPELEPIIPSNDEDGGIHLDWDYIYNASLYYIFRETSPIATIDGLTPIANSTYSSYYYDQISENGTYYYVIVANNGTVNSSISNCENVTCSIIPFYDQEPYITRLITDYDQTGEIRIRWTHITNAVEYYIYRDTSPISNIGGLDPIATVDLEYLEYNSYFYDQVYENGIYYYVVVANNGSTNSKPSSCKNIEISFTFFNPFSEHAPILYGINPNPSSTGIITIEWEKVEDSTNYYIYRETSPIISIYELTPKFSSFDQNNQTWHETQYYTDNITENGTYYYVIVAYNGEIYSSISNCESVEVIPEREKIKISGFNILTFSLVFSCTASIIIVSIRERRNSRNTAYINTS